MLLRMKEQNNLYEIVDIEGMTSRRIKNIRKLYGLSQVSFSDLVCVEYNTFRSWEGGYRYPSSPGIAILLIAEHCPKTFLKNRSKIIDKIKKKYRK